MIQMVIFALSLLCLLAGLVTVATGKISVTKSSALQHTALTTLTQLAGRSIGHWEIGRSPACSIARIPPRGRRIPKLVHIAPGPCDGASAIAWEQSPGATVIPPSEGNEARKERCGKPLASW
jgi:hypothetical protein